jgi:chemotaxis protein methyltransferase CheR
MTDKLSDHQLSQLSKFVSAAMGLYFPRGRWNDLERQAKKAAKEFGFDGSAPFIQWLLSSPLTQEQIESLASHLTIAETYFWREPLVFEALRAQILPDLIRAREKGNKRLRIWSAGCATGEEPYSIAIALHQVLPNLKDWNITLLATDINAHILRQAAVGVYRQWSFRNTPPGFMEKYFKRTDTGKYEILPEIRSMVTFAYLNLAEDVFPSSMNNTNAMDLIFCRNVLMYFNSARARQVGEHYYDALVEGGWLMVAASELSQHVFHRFSPIHFPGAIVYRKEDNKTPAAAVHPPAAIQTQKTTLQPPLKAVPPPRRPVSTPTTTTEPVRAAAPAADAALIVRELANQGKLSEAHTACEGAITKDKLNPGLYYLSATILQEQDRDGEAIAALKRALYLDPNYVLAHFAQGNLSQRHGKAAAAKKSFDNVLAILSTYNSDDILPEAEGLTAGRLREIVRATLQIGAST